MLMIVLRSLVMDGNLKNGVAPRAIKFQDSHHGKTFYYSAMNAGKSTNLLQSSYNYKERGMNTQLLTPAVDQWAGIGKIASRIGLEADARTFHQDDDLHALVEAREDDPAFAGVACVLIDEDSF